MVSMAGITGNYKNTIKCKKHDNKASDYYKDYFISFTHWG